MVKFRQPSPVSSSLSRLDLDELDGALLMIRPRSEQNVQTRYGVRQAVVCDIMVADGRMAGTAYPDAYIFPKVLCGQLRDSMGEVVLGRLGHGKAKTGQSAPWVLYPASAADHETAQAALAVWTASARDECPY